MKDETELLKSFSDKGVAYGNELIVFKKSCNDFLHASIRAGFAVIGIEGFYILKDGSVKPNMDEVADFSDIEDDDLDKYIEKCFKAANSFIKYMLENGKSDGYCFTLTDSV